MQPADLYDRVSANDDVFTAKLFRIHNSLVVQALKPQRSFIQNFSRQAMTIAVVVVAQEVTQSPSPRHQLVDEKAWSTDVACVKEAEHIGMPQREPLRRVVGELVVTKVIASLDHHARVAPLALVILTFPSECTRFQLWNSTLSRDTNHSGTTTRTLISQR